MTSLIPSYERTIEITEENVRNGAYQDPEKIVFDIIDEIDQLLDMKCIPNSVATEFKQRLFFLICGS